MLNEGTIIAKATPSGISAISVIRLSGTDSIKMVSSCFKAKSGKLLANQKSHTIHLGTIYDKEREIDEVLVSLFIGPNSYTGENVVEISCHGSTYIQQEIFQLFINEGAQPANAGEYTLRAFLNQKMDLIQAEAVADLIASESKAAHEVALNQMRGGYTHKIAKLRQQLLDFASLITLELDFSEEDVAFADRSALNKLLNDLKKKIKLLIDSFQIGSVIKHGVPVAIAGKPNAGKSSLLNALLNEDRAIVSSIPGTTRDTVEDTLIIDGIQFRFIDTAGLRETDDQIELIGVAKAKEKVNLAKILIYLFDRSDISVKELFDSIKMFQRKDLIIIIVENKIDLRTESESSRFDFELKKELKKNLIAGFIEISTFNIATINQLKSLLFSQLKSSSTTGDVIVSNVRHLNSLQNSLKAILNIKKGLENDLSGDLLTIDINEALHYLGEISGEITNDELLGNIFSKFCIGK